MKSIANVLLLSLAAAIIIARPNDKESKIQQNNNIDNGDNDNNDDHDDDDDGGDNDDFDFDDYEEEQCNVDPILMKKCNSTLDEADEFNYPECFFCLIHNCVDIGSKPKPNCADLYNCITDAICS
jgi:hypothetical protein